MKKIIPSFLTFSILLFYSSSSNAQEWKGLKFKGAFAIDETNGQLLAAGAGLAADNYPAVVTRFDGSQWESLGSGFSHYSQVKSIAYYQNEIYIGGKLTIDNGIDAAFNHIAKGDEGNNRWIPVNNGAVNGPQGVLALHVYEGELYAGGDFDNLGQTGINNIGKWDGTNFSNPTKVPPNSNSDGLGKMTVYNNNLYVSVPNDNQKSNKWNGNTNYNWETESNVGLIYTLYTNPNGLYKGTGKVAQYSDPVAKFYVNDPTPCIDQSVKFTDISSGSTSWAWSFPGGTPATSTEQHPNISYSALGNYDVILKVTNSVGSDSTIQVAMIQVSDSLAIATQPVSVEVCEALNGAINFTILASSISTRGLTYQWQLDSGLGSGFLDIAGPLSSQSSYAVQRLLANDGFKYRCKVSRCDIEVISEAATLTVNEGPSVVSNTSRELVCISGDASFTVETKGGTGVTYQWSFNGIDLVEGGVYSGVATNTLVLTGVDSSLDELTDYQINITKKATYKCTVSSSNRCDIYAYGYLTVYTALPPSNAITITLQPTEVNICNTSNGINARFSIKATNSATAYPIHYQWQVDDGNGFTDITESTDAGYSGFDGVNLGISKANANLHGYRYRCNLSASKCGKSLTSEAVSLQASDPPIITVQPKKNIGVCHDAEASISVSATGNNLSYQWQYFVTYSLLKSNDLSDGAFYSGSNSETLTIDPNAILGSNSVKSMFYRAKVTSGACTVYSSKGSITIQKAPTMSQQLKTINYTEICAKSESQLLVATSNNNYSSFGIMQLQWQVDKGTGIFSDLTEGSFYSNVNDPNLLIDSALYSFDQYQYRTVIKGCVNEYISDTVAITMIQLPTFTSVTESQNVCDGAFLLLDASATGTDVKYTWLKRHDDSDSPKFDTLVANLSSPTITFQNYIENPNEPYYSNFTYKCTATVGKCKLPYQIAESQEVKVKVLATSISIQTDLTKELCKEVDKANSVIFAVGLANETGVTYQWQEYNESSDIYENLEESELFSGVNNDTLTVIAHQEYGKFNINISSECINTSAEFQLYTYGVDQLIVENNNNSNLTTLRVINSFKNGVDQFDWFKDGSLYKSNGGTDPILDLTKDGNYTVTATKNNCEYPASEPYVYVILATGKNFKSDFSVYPNPSSTVVNLSMNADNNTAIQILSLDGKLVKDFGSRQGDVIKLNVSGLQAGTYLLQVNDGTEQRIEKIIIQ